MTSEEEIVLDESFMGDFGTCRICGKEYKIYGKNGLCDDCRYELFKARQDERQKILSKVEERIEELKKELYFQYEIGDHNKLVKLEELESLKSEIEGDNP